MQFFMWQSLIIAAVIIGSTQAAIVKELPNAQEFATSTSTLANIDGLLALPQEADNSSRVNSDPNTKANSFGNINKNGGSLQITPCSLRDPKKNECIRSLFSRLLPELKSGLPEYGLNSIDPYFYRRGIFRYADEGVQGGLLIKNVQIDGISNIKLNSFAANFTDDSFIIKAAVVCKLIKANGEFKGDIKFGGLRLAPKGPFNVTVDNASSTVVTSGSFTNNGNSIRIHFNRLNASVNIGSAKIVANGIFSDRDLNTMILNLVNENILEIIRIGVPATREQWTPILLEHINNYFAQVPIEKFITR